MFPLTLGGMDDQIAVVLIFGGGMVIAVVSILAKTIRTVMVSKHREESRRDIAAYVAEGSMTPEDGAKLLAEGQPPDARGSCWGGKA